MTEAYDNAADRRITELARTNPEEAERVALTVTERFPNSRRSWASLAYVYEVRGDFQEAKVALLKALAVEPDEPVSHFSLGRICIDLKEFDEAIEYFSRSIEISSEINSEYYAPVSRLLRAYCFCIVERYQDARTDLERLDGSETWWANGIVSKSRILSMCENAD